MSSNIPPWTFVSTFLLLVLIFARITQAAELEQVLLSGNYDDIQRVVIEDQVNNYQPAQQSLHTRPSKSLDGIYDFCLDESQLGFKESWHSRDLQSECNEGNYYRMPVPSAFNDISSNKTVRNYIGWLWYQTIVDNLNGQLFRRSDHREQLYIQFESVNYLATVWAQQLSLHANATIDQEEDHGEAKLLGSHVGGHLPFLVNLTGIRWPFRLTIAVNNNLTSDTIPSGRMVDLSRQVGRKYEKFEPDFDFFHFAGMIGSVTLFSLPHVHIREVRQTKLNSNCSNNRGECYHSAEFIIYPSSNIDASAATGCRYEFELWLDYKQLIASRDEIKNHCEPEVVAVRLDDSHLWEPANGRPDYFAPKLRVRIGLTGIVHGKWETSTTSVDRYELAVGFRPELEDSRMFRDKQLQGFGMHQEQVFSGRTMSPAAIMKDVYLLKQWGVNLIRTSHYPYSREFLEACRENGIPVIAECSAVGLKTFSELKLKLHKQLIREMVHRDQNNAAIIGWSVANEPQSQLAKARPYFRSLLEYCRKELFNYTIGSDRFLTAAIAQSHEDDKIGDLLDWIMINRYYAWYDWTGVLEAIERPLVESLNGWASKHPHMRLLISEFGADTVAGMHSLTDEIFSEEFQAKLIVEHERIFDRLFEEAVASSSNSTSNQAKPKFVGSMAWNFADFSTDVSLSRVGGNKKGVFTQDRRPKLAAHELRKIYLGRLRENRKALLTY